MLSVLLVHDLNSSVVVFIIGWGCDVVTYTNSHSRLLSSCDCVIEAINQLRQQTSSKWRRFLQRRIQICLWTIWEGNSDFCVVIHAVLWLLLVVKFSRGPAPAPRIICHFGPGSRLVAMVGPGCCCKRSRCISAQLNDVNSSTADSYDRSSRSKPKVAECMIGCILVTPREIVRLYGRYAKSY